MTDPIFATPPQKERYIFLYRLRTLHFEFIKIVYKRPHGPIRLSLIWFPDFRSVPFFLQYVTRPRAGTLDAQPRCQWESAEVVDLVSLQDIRWLDWLNSCSPLKEFLSHFLEERRKWSLACESNPDEADWSRLKHAPHIDFVLSLAFILHSLLSHFGPTTSSLLFDLPIVPRPLFRPRAHRGRRRRSCDRVYSCHFQVPTDLGLVSHQVQLEVLVPDVFILGPKDLIVDRGTTLSLVCIVENVREYPTTSTTTTGCRPCY